MKFRILLPVLLAALLAPWALQAAVPDRISYQGVVTDVSGNLVGDPDPVNRTVFFRIWSSPTATGTGDLIYSESQVVTISKGEFSVLLGGGAVVPGNQFGFLENDRDPVTVPIPTAFNGAARYLGVTVDDGTVAADVEISPRQQIVTTPFSLRAATADSVVANGITSAAIADGSITTNKFANGSITSDKLLTGAVGTTQIADNSITATDIADGSITASKLGGDIGAWTGVGGNVYRPSGNVGIGTDNPTEKLDVNGTIEAKGYHQDGSGAFGIDAAGFPNGRFYVEPVASGGSVGIGTAAPVAKLDIVVASGNGGEPVKGLRLSDGGGATAKALKLGINTAGNGYGYIQSSFEFTAHTPLALNPQGGNVGIGTATPTERLDVNGTVKAASFVGNLTGTASNVNGTVAIANGGTGSTTKNFVDLTSSQSIGGSKIFTGNNIVVGNGSIGAIYVGQTSGGGIKADYVGVPSHMGVFATSGLFLSAKGDGHKDQFSLLNNGNVGIGTATPTLARLQITGSASSYFNQSMQTMAITGVSSIAVDGNLGVSIHADAEILAATFRAFSDARIKNIGGVSDGAEDLKVLSQIEITDYRYKDVIGKGSRPQKKVIAQQVEELFPQAVSKSIDVVPDIYQKAAITDGWVTLATNLKVGERVRLIGEKEEAIHEVLEVRDGGFRTAFKPETDKLFVYGREVEDFRSVDYEAIAMLNVSATQQIKKEKDAEVKALQEENRSLRAALAAQGERLTALESRDQSRDAQLAAIEKLLQNAEKPAVQTVSLKTTAGVE